MGRHHIKLPDHLYITPPSPQPPSTFASASSFFSAKSGFPVSSTAFLLHTTSTTRAIERRIPGFKTSAAFLTALRANIDLQIDDLDSPADTPDCLRPVTLSASTEFLPPPSPLLHAMSKPTTYSDADLAPPSALPKASIQEPEAEDDLQEPKDPNALPELSTVPVTTDELRIEALRLVADSVAQQRQRCSRALIFHPITIGILAVAFGIINQFLKGDTGEWGDYSVVATTFFGVLMTALVSIRAVTGAYIEEAESVGTWKWLNRGRNAEAEKRTGKKILGDGDDEILMTKFGDEYIGTIVFRGVQQVEEASSTSKKSSRKSNAAQQTKAEIRGWTVRQKYRGKGVGAALLEDAIKISYDKGWAQGGIEIAEDHANNKVVVPPIFSGFVQANDKRTRKYLEKKVNEFEEATASGKSKRRR